MVLVRSLDVIPQITHIVKKYEGLTSTVLYVMRGTQIYTRGQRELVAEVNYITEHGACCCGNLLAEGQTNAGIKLQTGMNEYKLNGCCFLSRLYCFTQSLDSHH